MKKELDKALCEKYSKIFKDRYGDLTKTCMCWGLSCNDGWYQLIDTMCCLLQFHTDNNHYPQVVADQVKEKWGSLRFYYHLEESCAGENVEYCEYNSGFVEGVVSFATSMSRNICEDCGMNHKNGIRSLKYWYRSLCDVCTEKKLK